MILYLRRRLTGGLITLVLFTALVFLAVNALIPGDFTSQFIMTGEERQALRESLGLDRPLWDQYWTWVSGLATLNLGTSFSGADVWESVRDAMATSAFVLTTSLVVAFTFGSWLGRAAAWRPGRWLSSWSTATAVFLFTAFPPVLAFLLDRGLASVTSDEVYADVLNVDVLRGSFGLRPFGQSRGLFASTSVLWRMVGLTLAVLLLLFVLDFVLRRVLARHIPLGVGAALVLFAPILGWRVLGIGAQAADIALALGLIIVGVIALTYGEIMLITDAAMVDTVNQDYVLMARAKGLKDRQVRDRHAARAALLPVLSRLAVSIPYFFTGLAILETVFEVPGGLGNLLFDAALNQDVPMVVGALTVIGVVTLVLRLALDTSYALLDPRVRFSRADQHGD